MTYISICVLSYVIIAVSLIAEHRSHICIYILVISSYFCQACADYSRDSTVD
jgi:hypothetical protein